MDVLARVPAVVAYPTGGYSSGRLELYPNMTLYDCPECALPAVATPRGRRPSTSGPVDHVFVRCLVGHWFLGPSDMLIGADEGGSDLPDAA